MTALVVVTILAALQVSCYSKHPRSALFWGADSEGRIKDALNEKEFRSCSKRKAWGTDVNGRVRKYLSKTEATIQSLLKHECSEAKLKHRLLVQKVKADFREKNHVRFGFKGNKILEWPKEPLSVSYSAMEVVDWEYRKYLNEEEEWLRKVIRTVAQEIADSSYSDKTRSDYQSSFESREWVIREARDSYKKEAKKRQQHICAILKRHYEPWKTLAKDSGASMAGLQKALAQEYVAFGEIYEQFIQLLSGEDSSSGTATIPSLREVLKMRNGIFIQIHPDKLRCPEQDISKFQRDIMMWTMEFAGKMRNIIQRSKTKDGL